MKTGTKAVLLVINDVEIECTAHFDFSPAERQTHTDPGHPEEVYLTGLDTAAGPKEDLSILLAFEAIQETILEQI